MLTLVATTSLAACVTTGERVRVTELHNKQPVNLAAHVHRAGDGRAPTVILLHGCTGPVTAQTQDWVKTLNAWGFHAVALDSFGPRGATGSVVCQRPFSVVSPEQRGAEAHEVARWVTQQPWATQKVALVGFSHGGNAVLHAVASRDVQRNVGAPAAAAAVAFYPGCGDGMHSDKPAIPVQFHIGESDTWTAAGPCRDLARNWGTEIFTYPGAVHAFDIPGLSGPGAVSNWGTQHMVQHDPAAAKLAKERVRTFLTAHLRP
jgi:dienelactone hydrolase